MGNAEKEESETGLRENELPENGQAQRSSGTANRPDAAPPILGFLIILTPLYYFLAWRKFPFSTATKWGITAAIALGLVLIYVFFKARSVRAFELISKSIVVLFITSGAVISSILFTGQAQTQLFKLFVIFYFSMLPPWLYLQFLSTKGKTLWDEYVLNLFRLHIDHYPYLPEPPRHSIFYEKWRKAFETVRLTVGPGKSIYEKKFEGLFGAAPSKAGIPFSVFQGENLWPVAIATLIISVGWVMVVAPETIFSRSFLPAGFQTSGMPKIPLETLRFAFLGAYFYVLQMLVRRYFQNDLKTSAFVNSTMRIIVVMLLIWVIDLAWDDPAQQAQRSMSAFVIGVFPYVGWQVLQALIKLPFKLVIPSLRQQYPLSDLDGLNIWYESRLLEEGIEDMQNLATANLVDVMLNTRIPVDRLVDWVDQSLLYLHLGKEETEKGESKREKLRRFGIRCATDLKDVFASGDQILIVKLEYILNANKEEASMLRSILTTLENEPNLYHVEQWKQYVKIMDGRS